MLRRKKRIKGEMVKGRGKRGKMKKEEKKDKREKRKKKEKGVLLLLLARFAPQLGILNNLYLKAKK